jgi:FHA domain-containing protein
MPSAGAGSSPGRAAEARSRTRTGDPLLTMEVLYQLSYPGARRPTVPSRPRSYTDPVPTLILHVRKGPGSGAIHPVAGQATLGRGTGADILIPDEAVSRAHASIRVDGQTVVLEDLESSNGTLVNGEPIDAPRRLAPGDVVTVGSTELEVRAETFEHPATPTTPTVIQPRSGGGGRP